MAETRSQEIKKLEALIRERDEKMDWDCTGNRTTHRAPSRAMVESRSCLHRTNPLTDLLYLEQTGNVQQYFDAFKLLRSKVTLSEEDAIEIFSRGLELEIETCVRLLKPRSLQEAYCFAWLKESTITNGGKTFICDDSILDAKDCVENDEAMDKLGLVTSGKTMERSQNAGVSKVFDEMPVKKMVSVVDAYMLVEGLPESCFQDLEFQEEDVEEHVATYATEISTQGQVSETYKEDTIVMKLNLDFGAYCLEKAHSYVFKDEKNVENLMPEGEEWSSFEELEARIICELARHPKPKTPTARIWFFMYPSMEKGNLRLGRDMEAIYCQGCLCLIFSSMNLEDKVL